MNIFIDGSYSFEKNMGVAAYLVLSPDEVKIYKQMRPADLRTMLSMEVKYYEALETNNLDEVVEMAVAVALIEADNHKVTSVVDPSPVIYSECPTLKTNPNYKVCNPSQQNLSPSSSLTTPNLRTSQIIGKSKIYDVVKELSRTRLKVFAR